MNTTREFTLNVLNKHIEQVRQQICTTSFPSMDLYEELWNLEWSRDVIMDVIFDNKEFAVNIASEFGYRQSN